MNKPALNWALMQTGITPNAKYALTTLSCYVDDSLSVKIGLSELMAITLLSRPTVVNIIKELCDKGLIVKEKTKRVDRGNSSNLYRLVTDKITEKCSASDQNTGFIYFVREAGGRVKIGKSVNVEDRIKTFGVKLPFDIELYHHFECLDYHEAEKKLHKFFGDRRLGGEWFALNSSDLDMVKSDGFLQEIGIERLANK